MFKNLDDARSSCPVTHPDENIQEVKDLVCKQAAHCEEDG